jgi:hypothetical protein
MNLKRRLEALEKEYGIRAEELPALLVHFMSGWKYGEMTREEYDERNKITPEDQKLIDKEIARLKAMKRTWTVMPSIYWPPDWYEQHGEPKPKEFAHCWPGIGESVNENEPEWVDPDLTL